MMDGSGKSDGPIVPGKPPNRAGRPAAEAVEGRGPAKGNSRQRNALRTQSRAGAQGALSRVRQADASASSPKVGAGCGSAARPDLCGGRRTTGVPTATRLGRTPGDCRGLQSTTSCPQGNELSISCDVSRAPSMR